MKVYAINIPTKHTSLEVLSKLGPVVVTDINLSGIDQFDEGPLLVFVRPYNVTELREICDLCKDLGGWCFAWITSELAKEISEETFPSLVDFVTNAFSMQELELRLHRLVRLEKPNINNELLNVPSEITSDLTKKQIVILKSLTDAGELGLSKEELSSKIWKKESQLVAKASSFNVHMLHLRRRLESFGLTVAYDKYGRTYQLQTISKN